MVRSLKTAMILTSVFFASIALGEKMTKQEPLEISTEAFDASQVPFESHENYLSMPTPYEPIKPVFVELSKKMGLVLKNRGESHITVVTPPEFAILKDKVTMAEIEAIAGQMEMQKSKLEPKCVGEGRAIVDGAEERTYYLVLGAENLSSIRQEIQRLFESRGGEGFDAALFYPHITIGFTKTDLHIHQGVKKGEDSCVFPVLLK